MQTSLFKQDDSYDAQSATSDVLWCSCCLDSISLRALLTLLIKLTKGEGERGLEVGVWHELRGLSTNGRNDDDDDNHAPGKETSYTTPL